MSWLGAALLLILLGVVFGVGLLVDIGATILVVLLVLVLIGFFVGNAFLGRRRAA